VKTADSGTKRSHAFCPNRGTPIYSAAITDPPAYSLRIGSLTQRAQLPRATAVGDSALPWAMNLQDVPQLKRQ
jgi:hypothetical protein